MSCMRLTLKVLALVLVAGCAASAQVNVRGQFYMPGGDTPQNSVRFYITRSDGGLNEYRFSDSNGRFTIERASGRLEHTITVDSDGRSYGNTTYTFTPAQESSVRIYLNRLPAAPTGKPGTISANSGTKAGTNANHALEAGMKAVAEDHPAEAERLFKEAIKEDPKFPEPLIALGGLYMQQKKLAEAEKLIRQGLALDAKSAYGQMSLGIIMTRTDRYQEAIAPLREAIRLNADLNSPHLYLGVALVETEQFEEAERQLNIADNVTGIEETLRYLYLGQLYARTGRYEKSISAFESYLQRSPGAKNAGEVRALIDRMKQELAKPR